MCSELCRRASATSTANVARGEAETKGTRTTIAGTSKVLVRRIYDPPEPTDGARVLVDRLWPRGVSKERAELLEWCKEVAPSTELRQWYQHDPAKFAEFARRYRAELETPERAGALEKLRRLAEQGTLTLLTASKREDISEATVLQEVLTGSGSS